MTYFSILYLDLLSTVIMNAHECRTLMATCMHNYIMILCIILCMYNARSIELHTLHLNWGRHLAMPLYKLKSSVTYIN